MTYLFFDTETTGLPDHKAPVDSPKQPRLVQLGYVLTNDQGDVLDERCLLFSPLLPGDPKGWTMAPGAVAAHGIETKHAAKWGMDQGKASRIFRFLLSRADVLVAHNIQYDLTIMRSVMARMDPWYIENDKPFSDWKTICTMAMTKDLVCLPPTERMVTAGRTGHKNPKLSEAYQFFFDKDLEGAHDALVDSKACRDVFFAAKDMGRK